MSTNRLTPALFPAPLRHVIVCAALFGACSPPNSAGDAETGDASDTGAGSGAATNNTSDGSAADATGGHDGTTAESGGSSGTLDTGSTTDATTGGMGCIDHSECNDLANAICVGGMCTTCDTAPDPDGACSEATPDTPACVGGVCVECSETVAACNGNTPHCDLDTSTCLPCTEHAHCPDTACKIPSSFSDANDTEDDEGSCFSGDIIDLDPSDNLASALLAVANRAIASNVKQSGSVAA